MKDIVLLCFDGQKRSFLSAEAAHGFYQSCNYEVVIWDID
jgi:hypothetical protein